MCTQPITKQIRSSKYASPFGILIPCGKCLECLRDKQNEWVVRLYMESKYHSNILFFTLTYSPDSVPELVHRPTGEIYRTVYKKHLQDWFKRFRQRYFKKYGVTADLKYFITSEYGPKTKRPHYHGIIFGVSYTDFNTFALADWRINFGYVNCQEVKLSSDLSVRDKSLSNVMRYVGKYCMKGEFENPFVADKKVLPSFRLISKGIGKQYTLDIKDFVLYGFSKFKKLDYSPQGIQSIIDRSKIKIGSCEYSLPTFSKRIIYGEKTLLSYLVGQAILYRDDEVYLNQFRQIQTDWSISDVQTFRLMDLQENNTQTIRQQQLRSSFERIYNKSKI